MTTYTITVGFDTTATAGGSADTNYSTLTVVGVQSGPPIEYGFVYLPLPDEIAGATIGSATLVGYSAQTSTTTTFQAAAVTSAWSDASLTYNTMPTVGSTSPAVASGSVVPGSTVSLDLTSLVQAAASGANWYGVRIARTAGSSGLAFYSFESDQPAWQLTISTTDAPEQPQSLVPNGTVVGATKPTLTWDFVDNGGLSSDMAALQVQTNATNAWGSPTFDSGTVTSTVPMLDLTTTTFGALASGVARFWRVRNQDVDGNWSPWSDGVSMTYRAQPTITINTPAAGVLWDPTSIINATTSTNMSAFRVQVTSGTDRTDIKYDSGRLPATTGALTTVAVTLPKEYNGNPVFVDDSTYQLHIRVWDTQSTRTSTPGSPAYVDSWTTFVFNDDNALTPITTLTATQTTVGPSVTLTWTRAAAPDAWVVHRDGKLLEHLDPADTIVAGSTYSWDDTRPHPWVSHTYTVRALVLTSGVMHRSRANVNATITANSKGIWLHTIDGSGLRVGLGETDTSQLTVRDRRAIYKPVNLNYDVDIFTGFEGISGTLTGVTPTGLDPSETADSAKAVVLYIKEHPSQPIHLVFGTFSGRVLLRDVTIVPDGRGSAATPLHRVSFGINQVGHFEQVV